MAGGMRCVLSGSRTADAPARRPEDTAACHQRRQEEVAVQRAKAFIAPCLPTLSKEPPTGLGWAHEVKFDGFRVQVHRDGPRVTIYSRNGHDFTSRYPLISRDILRIPTKHFIIDAELTACDGKGNPDFGALLMGLADEVCIWVFDILSYRGKDIRDLHWVGRRYKLDQLMGTLRA